MDALPLLMAFIGIIICAGGIEGYFLRKRSGLERILLIAIGFTLIAGLVWPSIGFIGLGVLVALAVESIIRGKRRSLPA